jgi:hypothetical protein
MTNTTRYRLPTVAVGLVVIALAGCAETPPKPTFSHEIVADARIASPDKTQVSVDAPDDLNVLLSERERLAQKIQMKIDDRKITNVSNAAGRSYAVELHLTRYDKGNKFARFMLAGLGQIHIDGKVDLYQLPEHKLIGEFDLKKTFAWGGVYGATTDIEQIEVTFADGVAATVTGQSDDKQNKT